MTTINVTDEEVATWSIRYRVECKDPWYVVVGFNEDGYARGAKYGPPAMMTKPIASGLAEDISERGHFKCVEAFQP